MHQTIGWRRPPSLFASNWRSDKEAILVLSGLRHSEVLRKLTLQRNCKAFFCEYEGTRRILLNSVQIFISYGKGNRKKPVRFIFDGYPHIVWALHVGTEPLGIRQQVQQFMLKIIDCHNKTSTFSETTPSCSPHQLSVLLSESHSYFSNKWVR